MKIAVLSDIHGNLPALEAVVAHIEKWRPDRVFVAGDIINRGPRSLECLRLVLEKQKQQGWYIIRGNHEDYVLKQATSHHRKDPPQHDLDQFVLFTYRQVQSQLPLLASLPEIHSESTLDSGEIRMVHASMRHNREGIYPETSASALRQMIAPAPDVFITGHTHRALTRNLEGTLVVNAGSVGLPFDGDQRTGYAQLIWGGDRWQANLIRLDYDLKQAERDLYETGFMEEAGPLARLVLMELQSALSQLYQWYSRYYQTVLEGKLTVSEATDLFLTQPITDPYW
jgi:putative phosphoesterase